MSRNDLASSFRVGRVRAYRRGPVWYLCYHDQGQRRRPRVGPSLQAARELAAQTNAQLVTGSVPILSFEPISIPDLRQRWLEHHEYVLRSSVHTKARYRTATDHLLRFIQSQRSIKLASAFTARDAEEFVRYLRYIEVAPNGHRNSVKRRLLDKGIKFVLESCRALFSYGAKRRHLSAYADNPFTTIEVGRMPVEYAKPIVLMTHEQEQQFQEACDEWQHPIFTTLMLTGIRPGELCHLLIEDVDLNATLMHIRNKPLLGWQVKTRSERQIPIVPQLQEVLRKVIGDRTVGSVFQQRRFHGKKHEAILCAMTQAELEREASRRLSVEERLVGGSLTRNQRLKVQRTIWRDLGALSEDRVRTEFMRITKKIGLPHLTCPKLLRHGFATSLQDANVDPLIRGQLMGHAAAGQAQYSRGGLGMTAVYTHSREETIRRQLSRAVATHTPEN